MPDEPTIKTVEMQKTKTYQCTNDQLGTLGAVVMETPRGPVHVEDAPGFLSLQIDRDGRPHSIGLLVYEPLPGKGQGLIVQMSADSARAVAGSLMMLADRLEPVGKHDA